MQIDQDAVKSKLWQMNFQTKAQLIRKPKQDVIEHDAGQKVRAYRPQTPQTPKASKHQKKVCNNNCRKAGKKRFYNYLNQLYYHSNINR